MRRRLLFALVALLAVAPDLLGMETDQFTTPPTPLSDIGPLLSRKIGEIIEADRSGAEPEQVLAEWVGHNVLASRIADWVNHLRVDGRTVEFRPRVSASVFRTVLSPVPGSFLFDSPTVNIYGFYVGVDKLDHFLQQGHEYYEIATRHHGGHSSGPLATAEAVAHGVLQEHTYFGTLVSGIYSNADLAANYAGMKFYLNLRRSVRIGDELRPALLERTSQGWRFRARESDGLLRPFVSDHLNESLNPSRYSLSRGSIASAIRTRCDRWKRFYSDRLKLVTRGQDKLSTWFGETYGFWLPPNEEVSIATECSERSVAE